MNNYISIIKCFIYFLLLFYFVIPVLSINKYGYDLLKPNKIFYLTEILHEISGISIINHDSFICIQDENGAAFTYDLNRGSIIKKVEFHINGDYEGIARVDKDLYILRSDGILFEIKNYQVTAYTVNTYQTGVPANNNEGLCFDKLHNRLLIACKSNIENKMYKNKRMIYSFDINTKLLTKEPAYIFDIYVLKQFIKKNSIIMPTKLKGKKGYDPLVKFRISAIGIHPINGKLFILSAMDYLLIVCDQKGAIEYVEYLNSDLFNKAEGIAFFDNGDLLISNEGQNKKPTVLKFKFEKSDI